MTSHRVIFRFGLASGLLVLFASSAWAAPAGPYYLSLGTSLSVGIQPDENGENQLTDEGYADQLHRLLRLKTRRLQLVKLGCPGETSTGMITGDGSLCYDPGASQLDRAVAFLQANRGAVSLLSVDIGANDLLNCTIGDEPCILAAFAAVQTNLPHILGALRTAAPGVPIVAMNYYNPLVAFWLQGPAGQELAQLSAFVAAQFNELLEAVYGLFRVPVADVARAFHADDFRLIPGIGLPVNVVVVCQWTWMCAPAPVGPNVHANRIGYLVIALALAAALH
jgi:lysophospholipase L1-like esterase